MVASYTTTRRYNVVAEVEMPTITLLVEEISHLQARVEDTQKTSKQGVMGASRERDERVKAHARGLRAKLC
jgi:hypothetical protein